MLENKILLDDEKYREVDKDSSYGKSIIQKTARQELAVSALILILLP